MEDGSLGGKERTGVILSTGIVCILGVFVLPVFLLKLAILTGGVACIAAALLSRFFGRDRARSVLLAFSVFAITLGLSLVLAEFVVRRAFADVSTAGNASSYFGRRWRESVTTNALGFREREVLPKPAQGVYRIAVIGDSFTFGSGIARSDRMTERLEGLLSSLHVEVLNFGRSGAQTADHVETLRDIVLPVQPDFVLMQWYSNDVEGSDRSGRPRAGRLLPSSSASSWLQTHSALYYLVNQQWGRLQMELGLVGSYKDYMDQRFADPTSPDMVAAQAALEEFISIARDSGIGVGIVAFPDIVVANSLAEFPLGYLIDRVLDVCAAERIGCVDLRETFLGISDTEGWWASRLDAHPGPRANEAAAEAVATRFRDRWTAGTDAP